ncbi:MAG: hypothetical protein N2111_00005, partial [Candidatus Sumerlaeaceae bacterium]|nr:hypothetical protein [Candidatus Sumerlaeaceae bacterium]
MKHNATQALMSLMALALLAAALVPSSAYGADTALLDNIIKQHRANLAQVKTLRYDVAQVTQVHSLRDGVIEKVTTGTMTLKGDQMRFEFNHTQTGDTQPLNSNEQGVFLVNPDYAAHARPTVGLFQKIAHLADRSLAPEAAGHRDNYGANILKYADGLGSTTRLEDYLEKFRKAWSQASATQEPDGTIVLAWQNDGRDVVRIVLAGNQGFLVKSYRAFHPESAAPVREFDATVGEFKGEDGARVFLPVSISER